MVIRRKHTPFILLAAVFLTLAMPVVCRADDPSYRPLANVPIWDIPDTWGVETAHGTQGLSDWLPEGLVNVATGEFGDRIGGGDYGLGNYIPVDIITVANKPETRLFRSPILYLGHLKKANLQVKIGNITGMFFWIETPPVSSRWIVTLELLYPDGRRKSIWAKDTKPSVRHWIDVDPNTIIDVTVLSPEVTFKFSKRFAITFSPAQYAVWPDVHQSTPYRTLWE
ncbi:MAG: hypothetical protein LLG06_12080 [Desulfobacteraceae bacterium]|nr:hypothetical protein [Desulfobacteraceae bacterium]